MTNLILVELISVAFIALVLTIVTFGGKDSTKDGCNRLFMTLTRDHVICAQREERPIQMSQTMNTTVIRIRGNQSIIWVITQMMWHI
jgi:hypothetical protein